MKRMILMIAFAVLVAWDADARSRSLASMWKEYEEVAQKDMPQQMGDVLVRIREEAHRRHLPWDYYDACRKYVEVNSRRNWKLRDSLEKDAVSGFASFGEPLLVWLYDLETYDVSPDSLYSYITANSASLRKRCNKEVYSGFDLFGSDGVLRPFSGLLTESVSDDCEFALWAQYISRSGTASLMKNVYECLEASLGGGYPESALLKYRSICRIYPETDRKKELERMKERYEGRAAGLVAEQDLLALEFDGMEGKVCSDDYLAFKDRLLEFEKRRSAFKGKEKELAECCTGVRQLLSRLESESLAVRVSDSVAEFCLRNIGRLRVQVFRDESRIQEEWLYNEKNSLYAYDTLRLELHGLDDGRYVIRCSYGKNEVGRYTYDKNTVSVAMRDVAADDGFLKRGIYVADYRTGEPIGTADMALYTSDGKLVMQEEDVALDGFTDVPESFYAAVDPGMRNHYMVVSLRDPDGRLRSSRNINLWKRTGVDLDRKYSASVMLDRSAFNHGDTLRFKAVVFLPGRESMTVGTGSEVTVELSDAVGRVFGSKVFETNEFGSVAGEFVLDDVKRNGTCSIRVLKDGYVAGFANFVVDDHVLPAFDLSFEPSDSLYLVGEEVTVRGVVKSYSGHSLSSAGMKHTVSLSDGTALRGKLVTDSDGRFEISFRASAEDGVSSCRAVVEVTVTDETGETQAFSRHYSFYSRLDPEARVLNAVPSGVYMWPEHDSRNTAVSRCIVSDDIINVLCTLKSRRMSYSLRHEGRTVHEGTSASGDTLHLDMTGLASGIYEFILTAEGQDGYGRPVAGTDRAEIFLIRESDMEIPAEVSYMFRPLEGGGVSFQAGSGTGPLWAVAELYDGCRRVLDRTVIRVSGASSEERTLVSCHLEYREEYPDEVRLVVTGFRDGDMIGWEHRFTRPVVQDDLILRVEHMEDRAHPDSGCRISLKTAPDAEILVAVFDKSSERIRRNRWAEVKASGDFQGVYVSSMTGRDGSGRYVNQESFQRKSAAYVSVEEEADEAIPFQLAVNSAGGAVAEDVMAADVVVREDFSTTLAFEPFIRPDESGMADFRFRTSDKLSTYVIQVFAHDKDMDNAVLRRDILVTLPVKVSVSAPRLLREGDRYVLNASVSSTSDRQISGVLSLEVYDGPDYRDVSPVARFERPAAVPAGGNVAAGFEMDVPSGVDTLGFKLVFAGGNAADAVFVTVPVSEAAQTLVESHSAVLSAGMSRDKLEDSLRSSFVNTSAMGAEYAELSLRDMLTEAVPVVREPGNIDLVSQCNALYVNLLGYGLHRAAGEEDRTILHAYAKAAMDCMVKVLDHAHADGGFGWLQGMKSSSVMTAYALECFAGLRDRGLLDILPEYFGEDVLDDFDEAVSDAVAFLDKEFFVPSVNAGWNGPLSPWQYLYIRSQYAAVPFDAGKAEASMGKEAWKDFRKFVNSSVSGSGKDGRITKAGITDKVRMLRTLLALDGSEEGRRLASAWGVGKPDRMSRTFRTGMESLLEYAVEHPSGGWYYPNAVLPWRGLLESEVYAHSMICDLLRDTAEPTQKTEMISDGIRLWIMLQKETQQWSSDPGYVAALASVYDGSESLLETRVVVLGKRYRKMFDEIQPYGNGMSISVKYYRETSGGQRTDIAEGDTLRVGEKVVGVYSLWSQENRSFVRLSVPRPACFHPADLLSGWEGGWIRPHGGISPYCYREVKTDRSLYWVDVFPEEKTVFEEELFVTQEGRFVSPVSEIECLYAPHYRANTGGGQKFLSDF